MWLARPVYEALPLALIGAGLLALVGVFGLGHGFWGETIAAAGLAAIVLGLVLQLRRRGYRASRSRLRFEDSEKLSGDD